MTENTPVTPQPGTPGTGASALLEQAAKGDLGIAAMSRADIMAELTEIQRIARPSPEQLQRGLALRAAAMRPDYGVLGQGVSLPEDTMKGILDQSAAIAEVERESGLAAFQRHFGVDERWVNHARNNLEAVPLEYELAGPEREACIRDPEFLKRFNSNSRERIYGMGGPDDQKFREWMATLVLVLASKVAK